MSIDETPPQRSIASLNDYCTVIRERGSGPVLWWRDIKLAQRAAAECNLSNPIIATRILPIYKMPRDLAHVVLTERANIEVHYSQIAGIRNAHDLDISIACPSQEMQTLEGLIESGSFLRGLEIRKVEAFRPGPAKTSDAPRSDEMANPDVTREQPSSETELDHISNRKKSSSSCRSAEEAGASAEGNIENSGTEKARGRTGTPEPNKASIVASSLAARISGVEPDDNEEFGQNGSQVFPNSTVRSDEPDLPPPLTDEEIAFFVADPAASTSMPRYSQDRPALPIYTHNLDRLIEHACKHLRKQRLLFVLRGSLCKLSYKSRRRQGDAEEIRTATAVKATRQDVRAMFSDSYIAVANRGRKWVAKPFSKELCETVLNRASDLFEPVKGQIDHPLFWQGQTLSGQIGFHDETGLLISGEKINVKPCASDEQAKVIIDKWTVAIPARSHEDRYRIVLLALSIYATTLSLGGRPIFMVRADQPDAGKTWASQCAIAAVLGHDVETVAWPRTVNERSKLTRFRHLKLTRLG